MAAHGSVGRVVTAGWDAADDAAVARAMISLAPFSNSICVPTGTAIGVPVVVVAAAEFQPVTQADVVDDPL